MSLFEKLSIVQMAFNVICIYFREIKDELYVSGGRASLVDLAQTLNVDFSHVEYQVRT